MSTALTTGIQLYISTTRMPEAFKDLTDAGKAAALAVINGLDFIRISKVEDIGEHKDSSAIEKVDLIDEDRPLKGKGNADPGSVSYKLVFDTTDDGQAAVKTAYEFRSTTENYVFKLIHPNGMKLAYSGIVNDLGEAYGATGKFIRRNITIERTSGSIYIPAVVTP